MNLHRSSKILKKVVEDLQAVGVPITGIYMPTNDTDSGVEINNQYVLQIAPYYDPIFLLDPVDSPGEEIASFSNTDQLIQFLMET